MFGWLQSRPKQDYMPVILVTGCSSGVGLQLARLLWEEVRFRVVVTAREQSIDKIKEQGLHDTHRFWVRPLDVTKPYERRHVIDEIEREWGGVDILVNNAGFAYRAVIEHMDDRSDLDQLATNYLGPMGLIRLVLPFMRNKGRGKIINVSSVSGMLAMPTMGAYSASKHALEGAIESLWYEMKPFGVDVCLIQPGFIKSNSFRKVRFSTKSQREKEDGEYADFYTHMGPFIEKLMGYSWVTSKDVAIKILDVIESPNPRFIIPATPDAVLFYYLRKILPRRWFQPILNRLLPGASTWGKSKTRARERKWFLF